MAWRFQVLVEGSLAVHRTPKLAWNGFQHDGFGGSFPINKMFWPKSISGGLSTPKRGAPQACSHTMVVSGPLPHFFFWKGRKKPPRVPSATQLLIFLFWGDQQSALSVVFACLSLWKGKLRFFFEKAGSLANDSFSCKEKEKKWDYEILLLLHLRSKLGFSEWDEEFLQTSSVVQPHSVHSSHICLLKITLSRDCRLKKMRRRQALRKVVEAPCHVLRAKYSSEAESFGFRFECSISILEQKFGMLVWFSRCWTIFQLDGHCEFAPTIFNHLKESINFLLWGCKFFLFLSALGWPPFCSWRRQRI